MYRHFELAKIEKLVNLSWFKPYAIIRDLRFIYYSMYTIVDKKL